MTKILYGYKPMVYQNKIHQLLSDSDGKGLVITVKARRQCGKSMMAENELLRWALNKTGSYSLIVEPTLAQSRKIGNDIYKAVKHFNIIKSYNLSTYEMKFKNGSIIQFKSAEQGDGLRSFTVNGILIIDEAAFIQNDIFDILLPTVEVNQSPILIISTPLFRFGRFYDFFIKGNLDNNKKFFSFDWSEEDTSSLIGKDTLESMKRVLSVQKFNNEYLGEFYDEGGSVFSNIQNSIIEKNSDWSSCWVGIDWGTGQGQDYTAIISINEHNEVVYIDYFNNLTPLEQIDRIKEYLNNEKRIVSILIEINSIGTIYLDLLKNAVIKSHLIKKFTTNNKTKTEGISKLVAMFEQNTIKIPNNNMLINQLQAYEIQKTKTGLVTYNAKQGYHDDLVMALMFAIMYKSKGNYNIN